MIVVESDHYDLFPETDGRLLEVLAVEAGALFARRESLSLLVMYRLISRRAAEYLPDEVWKEAGGLPDYLSRVIEAYRRMQPNDAGRIQATSVTTW